MEENSGLRLLIGLSLLRYNAGKDVVRADHGICRAWRAANTDPVLFATLFDHQPASSRHIIIGLKLMKILALSDRIVEANHSPQLLERHGDVDLVIGCGDLPYYYLEYITTTLAVPVFYVHGNHDKPTLMANGSTMSAPGGCTCLEERCLSVKQSGGPSPLLIAGLGGSMSYSGQSPHQYSEGEMRNRALALLPQLMANRARYGRFLDILVTHAPPFGIHDGEDLPHVGFRVFLTLLRLFKPRFMLHGHTHIYRRNTVSTTDYAQTRVMNVYPSRIVEWEDE